MKIKFENDLVYQQEALASVVDVFKGQDRLHTNFSVESGFHGQMDMGYANKLSLVPGQIIKNIQEIQTRNGLPVLEPKDYDHRDPQFTIDMETGTGKTYVFTRSILEMNKRYGFTKFLIVVPSVSIREGIAKSLEMTQEHFKTEFNNVPYKHFIYDSKKLSEVRDFATSNQIRIMIINIQAFAGARDTRIFNEYNDSLGARPISLVQETNPIIIVDEPQSTMSTKNQQTAIKGLNPLATFRYSATHKEKINTLFKFDAVDAYNDGKVKRIEVASLTSENDVSDGAYMAWHSISNRNGISAKLSLDVKDRNARIKRQTKSIKKGTDLYEITNLEQYFGHIVEEINIEHEYIHFTNGTLLKKDEVLGGVSDSALKRALIKRTIQEHLDKEMKLNPKGIKVLSLFFIDAVAKYKLYDEDGNPSNGEYGEIFEEEYNKLIKLPKYANLFEEHKSKDIPAEAVHKGYFSVVRKRKKSNSRDRYEYFRDTSGTTLADVDTYELIMKDKERLLSFKEPVRFIFSHSALKEGWDNPNVFQICMLKEESASEIRRRQEIGRGLRIAVNQEGVRVYDADVNILTAMVTESFSDFVKGYQKELSDDTGIRFGFLDKSSFNSVVTGTDEDNQPIYLGVEESTALYEYFMKVNYIDEKGKVQDDLKIDLKENTVDLGKEYNELVSRQILVRLREIAGSLDIKDADERMTVKLNKEVYLSEDFKKLWSSIRDKTMYQVEFDSEELIKNCIEVLNRNIRRKATTISYEKADIEIDRGGVSHREAVDSKVTEHVETEVKNLPDIISYLQEATDLTRRTILSILLGIEKAKLNEFKINPLAFIEQCVDHINFTKRNFITKGIKYQRLGDEYYYDQKLIEEEFITYKETGTSTHRIIDASKSPYEKVLCDSVVESDLAKEFEQSQNIALYTKLPHWFRVPTPLGDYNPDWAVLYKKTDGEKLYFITETKGSIFDADLRANELAKIKCGEQHFKAINNRLIVARELKDIEDAIL